MRTPKWIPTMTFIAAAILLPASVRALTLDDFISVSDPESTLFFEFCVIDGDGLPNSTQSDLDQLDLAMAVSWDGSQFLFEFVNASPISSAITDIYFDDSTSRGGSLLIENGSVYATAGPNVSFVIGDGTPPDLPSGNNVEPPFEANIALSAFATDPAAQDGVNGGENLVLAYDLASGASLEDIGLGLLDGTLRVGLHVQSIGSGSTSDAFYACPLDVPPPPGPQDPVPEPASLVLLGMGCAFLVSRMRLA